MRANELGMPALLNITWSPPKCPTAKSTSACTSSASETSVRLERGRVAEGGRQRFALLDVDVGDDDLGAFRDEQLGGGAADPARTPGDDRDLARELLAIAMSFHQGSSIQLVRARVHTVASEDRVDLREIGVVDRPPERADVVLHLGDVAAARRATCSPPGATSSSGARAAAGSGRTAPRSACSSSAAATLRGITSRPKRCGEQRRHHAPLVGLRHASRRAGTRRRRRACREQAVGERSVGHEPDALLLAVGQDLALHASVEQVQAVLRRRRRVGSACTPRCSSRVKFETPTNRALPSRTTSSSALIVSSNGVVAVGPVDEVHVDVVGTEVLQALVDRREDALAAAVAEVRLVGVPGAELGDDDRLVATAAERAARAPAPTRRSRTPRRCRSS